MARKREKVSKKKLKRLKKQDMKGFKHFRVLADLTEHLHEVYIDPKHPNKRKLHYDQYLSPSPIALSHRVHAAFRV